MRKSKILFLFLLTFVLQSFALQACGGNANAVNTAENNSGENSSSSISNDSEIEESAVPEPTRSTAVEIPDLTNHILFFGDRYITTHATMLDPNSGTMQTLGGQEGFTYIPYFSPNGQEIAYLHVTNESDGAISHIHVMDVNGENERLLLDIHPAKISFRVSWSPDGSQIAFVKSTSDTRQLVLVNVETGTETTLPVENAWGAVQWSPDGRQIAFLTPEVDATGQETKRFLLQVIDVNGENLRQLVVPDVDSNPIVDFTWSPDGTQIAFTSALFVSNGEDDSTWQDFELHILNLEAGSSTVILQGTNVFGLIWGNDGNDLYFLTFEGVEVYVHKVSAQGGEIHNVYTLVFESEIPWYALYMNLAGDKLAIFASEDSSIGLLSLDGSDFKKIETNFDTLHLPGAIWVGDN